MTPARPKLALGAACVVLGLGSGAARADETHDLWRLEQELKMLQREAEHLNERLGRARQELDDWKTRLEALRPLVPAGTADAEARLRRLAREADLEAFALRPVAVPERLPLADGGASPLEVRRFELGARGPLAGVARFLLRTAVIKRVVGVESLRLEAGPGGLVSLGARLALPSWIEGAGPPQPPGTGAEAPPPPGASDAVRAAHARVAAQRRANQTAERALETEQAWIMGTIQQLGSLAESRFDPVRLVEALAGFAGQVQGTPAALTEVRLDGEVFLEGVVGGGRSAASLEAALTNAGLLEPRVQLSPAGECAAFSARARLGEEPTSLAGPPLPADLFDRAAACRPGS